MATVLVADDIPQVRRMIRFTLEGLGHRVLEAVDGTESWQLIQIEHPDMLILDVMMPGLSGLDICRKIRSDAELAALPVIILTASGGAEIEDDTLAAGATRFMTKPFSPAALRDAVSSLIGA